jgi:predicted HicB family RNase H-like nuclease
MTKNINIELPDNIHRELKIKAIESDKSLKDLVIEILAK